MSKKEYILVGLAVALVGVYVVFFSDWFQPKFIRIEHTVRPSREAWSGAVRQVEAGAGSAGSVTFVLRRNYRLTGIRVFVAGEIRTNKHAHPVWHLVSREGSAPAGGFAYGFPLPGMAPAVAGAEPDALQPGVEYRLLVEAGPLRGTNDFKLGPQVSARR